MKGRLSIVFVLIVVIGMALLAFARTTTTAQSPPFTQCPPVGADTSCAILLVIDANGSLRVKTDPSQGPYDLIEDTLIGVQNNSSNTITSIPLSSTINIFGFDGDGICASFITPHPAGCPFGSTGYEGPGVSFTNINAAGNSGTVSFVGGIPPGGSAYFSLEERIEASCGIISGIQAFDLKQYSSPWATDTYDNDAATDAGGKPNNIQRWGCYLTACVNIINYQASRQHVAFNTTPRDLNNWLINNDGYSGDSVDPSAVAKYARQNGVTLHYQGRVDNRNDFILDSYVCNNNPILLKVPRPGGTHFVMATGQTTVNNTDTYSINDPGHSNRTTLEPYNFTYLGIRKFSSTPTTPSGLYVYAHSPVQLFVTDPSGRNSGYDPTTGQVINNIPNSGYASEAIGDDIDLTSTDATPEVKEFEVLTPISGFYTVQVIGTGLGPYMLDFRAYDVNGDHQITTITGTTIPGLITTYQVEYSSIAGSPLTVMRLITNIRDIMADVTTARQSALIDGEGITNSLLQKLQAASNAMDRGDSETARNILGAFINEVSAQAGKHIQTDAANLLINDVNVLFH